MCGYDEKSFVIDGYSNRLCRTTIADHDKMKVFIEMIKITIDHYDDIISKNARN